MTADVWLRPEAERDLEDAASWYEQQRGELGQEFLDEVLRVLSSIGENPRLNPVVHKRIRRALLRRFPFGVFYQLDEPYAVVLAVMHAKRDPSRWKQRA